MSRGTLFCGGWVDFIGSINVTWYTCSVADGLL